MSEELNASGAAAGEQDAIVGAQDTADIGAAAAGAIDAGAQGTLADLTADIGAAAAPANWPEDWREKLTNGDDAGMKILKRIASPDDLYKKLLAQEQTIRRGAHKTAPTLPEGATDEQIAEYRKAAGVPETPDGYGIAFAPEFQPSEADITMLQAVLADAHSQNVPAPNVKAMTSAYMTHLGRLREEAQTNLEREFAATKAELSREYGADYLRNVKLLQEMMERQPGIAPAVRANRHNKSFMKDMIVLARATATEEALYGGDGQDGGMSLDERIAAFREKAVTGKLTATENAKYNELMAARIARDNRRNSQAA